jgi:hypothetical protein
VDAPVPVVTVPVVAVQVAVGVTVYAAIADGGGIDAVGAILPVVAVSALSDAKGVLDILPFAV